MKPYKWSIFYERRMKMEVKKGENTYSVPAWAVAIGFAMVGGIVTDICKTVTKVLTNK